MILSRRSFIAGIIAAASAPMIVRASSLMPVKVMPRHDELLALLARKIAEADDVMRRNMSEWTVLQGYGLDDTVEYVNPDLVYPWTSLSASIEFKRAT